MDLSSRIDNCWSWYISQLCILHFYDHIRSPEQKVSKLFPPNVLQSHLLVWSDDHLRSDNRHNYWLREWRLDHYYLKKQGSGLVGIYLTIFLMAGMIVLNSFIFYNYMIFVHMNGRILDLYKRLSGSMKSFFIPHDNEVSLKYVQWVVERAKRKNFILRSAR